MESFFWYFPFSALINAITSVVLGFYLIFTNYQKRIVRYLFYFCITAAWWSISYFFWQVTKDGSSALWWVRLLMFGAIFSSVSYFHLVLVFLNLLQIKLYKNILVVFYAFAGIFSLLNLTTYFVAGVEQRLFFKFWPIPGKLYTPFLVMFAVQVILASVLLFRKFLNTKNKDEKMQSVLLLLGLFVAFIGGSTNYPLWYNIPILPWGNGLVTIYVVLTVYAIMKYRFMDIRVIFAELFSGLMMIIFSIDVALSKTLTELIFRLFALLIMIVFGILLIRSVRKEVRRREEITVLAKSLEEANVSLRKLDQQKTEFLSIASHQLRTPLSILNGYIELLKDGAYGKLRKPAMTVLQNMDESNGRLISLVDEFLNITRIEQGRVRYDFVQKDIRLVVDSVVEELRSRAEQKGLFVEWKRPVTAVKVFFDEEKIRHVVFNYIDNGIKYSETGAIVVQLRADNDGVVLTAKDEGIGFERIDEVNFFQKFYRGENVKGTNVNGTGLGLYVCSKFVEAHHGRVWAKSEGLSHGSEFGFWIPYKQKA
jgi:signal transduction histidine kinase